MEDKNISHADLPARCPVAHVYIEERALRTMKKKRTIILFHGQNSKRMDYKYQNNDLMKCDQKHWDCINPKESLVQEKIHIFPTIFSIRYKICISCNNDLISLELIYFKCSHWLLVYYWLMHQMCLRLLQPCNAMSSLAWVFVSFFYLIFAYCVNEHY